MHHKNSIDNHTVTIILSAHHLQMNIGKVVKRHENELKLSLCGGFYSG